MEKKHKKRKIRMINSEKTKDPTKVHIYKTRIAKEIRRINISGIDIEKLRSNIKNIITDVATNFLSYLM